MESEYETLQHLYYSDRAAYAAAYEERFHSPYTHHVDFMIGKDPAFFQITPAMQSIMLSIQKADKKVSLLRAKLPRIAIEHFSLRCLIDELVLSNSIEGVYSTRRELESVLSSLKENDRHARFRGLVQKYTMLQSGGTLALKTCADLRGIYDELVLSEVAADDPDNKPDGAFFRKGHVSVQSPAQKEIHRGLYPESAIIEAMEKALRYLNDEREELLLRTAVFHYLLGYIHPFYDGNGRLNRFISSYMLSQELDPLLGYRLSYTIKEHIDRYYAAFKVCNHPLDRGDLTPFVLMFLDIVERSVQLLAAGLQKRSEKLEHYLDQIAFLPEQDDTVCLKLYQYLIQAELFSEHGISTKELLHYLRVSRGTLRTKLNRLAETGFLKVGQVKRDKYYGIDLNALDEYISALPLPD